MRVLENSIGYRCASTVEAYDYEFGNFKIGDGDKDSREHFETRTHRRLIDIYNPSSKTIDALMKLDLPSGVDIEVKL